MLRIAIAALAGAYLLHQSESLPSAPWLIATAVIASGLLLEDRLRPLAALLLGYLCSAAAAHMAMAAQLQTRFEAQTLQFDAVVEDFPVRSGEALRLILRPLDRADLPPRIRLSWYEPDTEPQLAEVWQVTARLRAPRGLANPNGFDYEAWLYRQRIGATGYIVSAARVADRSDAGRITELRRHFLERCHDVLPDDAARAVLTAVTIGARQHITRAQWENYARTGTSHLMAISGLHIGLAAAGLFLLVRLLAAPFATRRNIRDIAVIAAAAGATGYTLVSGLAVPAQRALLMVLLATAMILMRKPRSYGRILALACISIMAADPLAVLAPGFQLSFFAVALLLWWGCQFRASPWQGRPAGARLLEPARGLLRLQLVLLFGLMPLTVILFDRISWLAPLVNLLALPLFNFLTVPLSLLALVLDGPMRPAGDLLLLAAHFSVATLLWIVDQAAALPQAGFHSPPLQGAMLAVLWATGLWAALPPGFPGRHLALIAAAAVILHAVPPPPRGCVDLHVLDVGQGLSAVAATHSHVLVFDAGPAFRSGSDTGELVVVPFLQSLGRIRIDALLVSHADLDHAGGVQAILERVRVEKLLESETSQRRPGGQLLQRRCEAGMAWHWDGIDFRVLHPKAAASGGNNSSCVLEISAGTRRALFTGDIEAAAERSLLSQGVLRPSDFVLVPHHGSRTSSTMRFVAQLDSGLAVVSAGFGNRWGLPKPDVVARWQSRGTRVLSTATSGAISQRLCAGELPQPVIEQRTAYRRYWHANP